MDKPEWPRLVINLKQHVLGRDVENYIWKVAPLTREYNQSLIICPALVDLERATRALKDTGKHNIQLYAQKVDSAARGDSATGAVSPDSLKELGIHGSLLNHKEARIYGSGPQHNPDGYSRLVSTMEAAVNRDLYLIVCADGAETAARIAKEVNDRDLGHRVAIAVEWDEFIGKRISMVKERPDEIRAGVAAVQQIVPRVPVYCGAGVETAEDILKAIEMGAQGALAATGFTKAPRYEGDFSKAVEDVLKALPKVS